MPDPRQLLGHWAPDFERWAVADPDMLTLTPNLVALTLGSLDVEFDGQNLAIRNYGRPGLVQDGPYVARDGGDVVVVEATRRSSGNKGVFEITFEDEDHIVMRLVEPKRDVMALVRRVEAPRLDPLPDASRDHAGDTMSAATKMQGSWKADLGRWAEADPSMEGAPQDMLKQMLGAVAVTITADSLVIENYGKPGSRQEFGLSLAEDSPGKAVLEATRAGSDKKGIYEVELADDDHMLLRLTSPKLDVMALQRA